MKQATSRRLTFQNRFLRVDLDAAEVTWSVTEKATGVVWRMAPASACATWGSASMPFSTAVRWWSK